MSAKEIKKGRQAVRRRRVLRTAARTLSVGLGSGLALYGNYHTRRLDKIIYTSDAEALRNDWIMIGSDMNSALTRFKSDHNL